MKAHGGAKDIEVNQGESPVTRYAMQTCWMRLVMTAAPRATMLMAILVSLLGAAVGGNGAQAEAWPAVRVAFVEGLNLRYDPFAGVDLGALTGKSNRAMSPKHEILTASIDNKGAVKSGPTKPTSINTLDAILIKSIQTYHWNNGRGSSPGTIAIQGADGKLYGRWPAVGLPGQDNVPDIYWRVEPEITLAPGKYQIVDSDPSTWATNAAAGNRGFVVIRFQKLKAASQSSAKPEMQPQTAPSERTKRYANPMIGEFRLDWCLKNQKNCGKPAADAFCRFWHMEKAVSFKKAEDVGKREPTREILDGALCEKPSCDGFSEIICR